MLYALLIYETPNAFAERSGDENTAHFGAWRDYYQAVVAANIYAGGDPLEVPETATTVRQKEGKRLIQDGPYANTKEQLGGIMILDLPSLDAALDWAARCPAAAYGAVEVRPLSSDTHRRVTGSDAR
jgi:hypothetical protein